MSAPLPMARELADGGLDWIVPEWDGPSRVHAMFTTRTGGASVGAAASFDLGPALPPAQDDAGSRAIGENRRRLRALLPGDPVWLQQVHGVDVALLEQAPSAPPVADAAVTRVPDLVLTVRTADCLPILLADRAGTVLAVAHAGWRGLAAGVVENTLAAMEVATGDVCAWIGPAISARAFEVGPDVVAAFGGDPGAPAHFRPLREGKWMADLPGLARARLARAGITSIASGAWCTHGDAARFFSYRRDPGAGRMALVAWLAV